MILRLVPLVLLLAACDPAPPPDTDKRPNPVFESQIQAMEKARALETQVRDAADAQRQQIDSASQP